MFTGRYLIYPVNPAVSNGAGIKLEETLLSISFAPFWYIFFIIQVSRELHKEQMIKLLV